MQKEDTKKQVTVQSISESTRSLIEIHCSTYSLLGKGKSIQARMNWLGIEDCSYERYEEMFLRPRENHHFITLVQTGWKETKHTWNKNIIIRHLCGERTIGLFPAPNLDYLMIDIDRHQRESESDVITRINKVIEVVGGDPLIYQSSFSGGMRLCFFMENMVYRDALYKGCKNLLESNKVIVKPGSIEIMAGKKGDRLPFGEGSYLIDPFNLEPIYHLTLKETITKAYDVFQHQKIELPFEIRAMVENPVPESSGWFEQIVDRLYVEGLYPEITTNDALMKMAWDLIIRKGFPKHEAECFLVVWIKEKHNGLSNRINSGKIDQVLAQIKRIVQSTDPSKAGYLGSRFAIREKKLSLSDVRQIISLTQNKKLQTALFSLLEYCFCFGKTYSHTPEYKNKISNLYVSEKGHVTYVSGFQENYYCELSQETLRHLNGFDKANPQSTMKKLEALRIVSLKRRAHPQSHHCRQYWIHFVFNENDYVKVVSLDEGLHKLRGAESKNSKNEKSKLRL